MNKQRASFGNCSPGPWGKLQAGLKIETLFLLDKESQSHLKIKQSLQSLIGDGNRSGKNGDEG